MISDVCGDRWHLHTLFSARSKITSAHNFSLVGCEKQFHLVIENVCLFTRKAEISSTVDITFQQL